MICFGRKVKSNWLCMLFFFKYNLMFGVLIKLLDGNGKKVLSFYFDGRK